MMSTRPFSELKVSEETVEFEREQISIYESLIYSDLNNKKLILARDELLQQVSDHEKELKIKKELKNRQIVNEYNKYIESVQCKINSLIYNLDKCEKKYIHKKIVALNINKKSSKINNNLFFLERILKRTIANLSPGNIRSRHAQSFRYNYLKKTNETINFGIYRKSKNILKLLNEEQYGFNINHINDLIKYYTNLIESYPNNKIYNKNKSLLVEFIDNYKKQEVIRKEMEKVNKKK